MKVMCRLLLTLACGSSHGYTNIPLLPNMWSYIMARFIIFKLWIFFERRRNLDCIAWWHFYISEVVYKRSLSKWTFSSLETTWLPQWVQLVTENNIGNTMQQTEHTESNQPSIRNCPTVQLKATKLWSDFDEILIDSLSPSLSHTKYVCEVLLGINSICCLSVCQYQHGQQLEIDNDWQHWSFHLNIQIEYQNSPWLFVSCCCISVSILSANLNFLFLFFLVRVTQSQFNQDLFFSVLTTTELLLLCCGWWCFADFNLNFLMVFSFSPVLLIFLLHQATSLPRPSITQTSFNIRNL